jgi:hypothetical protein
MRGFSESVLAEVRIWSLFVSEMSVKQLSG